MATPFGHFLYYYSLNMGKNPSCGGKYSVYFGNIFAIPLLKGNYYFYPCIAFRLKPLKNPRESIPGVNSLGLY